MTSNLTRMRVSSIIKPIFFFIVFTGLLFLFSMFKTFTPSEFERFTYGILGTIAALLTTWIFLRVEKKSFKDIGLRWESKTLLRFLLGFTIGLFLCFSMILGLVFISGLKFSLAPNYNIGSFLLWSLALIPLAYMEEIAFRAYPFINLQTAVGIRITQVIIAILFALYHFAGGQSLLSSFLGPGLWSFVFGLAMIMSGGISLPTGLHFGVNLVLAAIGQQKGFQSIWTIQYRDEISAATNHNEETVGYAIQIILFVSTIVIMEWYIRKKRSR